ncbi:MAG: hypothetical protein OXL34_00675 [Gemmatimonadota bacterium]|nr:hypothetical protein [Gemmatimonadota bacterium]
MNPGKKSRRKLDPETAPAMARVREARRAYRKFYAMCFWSYRKDLRIGHGDVDWVTETLKKKRRHACLEGGGANRRSR